MSGIESAELVEAMGVRVRFVKDLSERAIYFQKHGLALVDALLDDRQREAILEGIADELVDGIAERLLES